MRIENLGQLVSEAEAIMVRMELGLEEVRAFGAPSECRDDVIAAADVELDAWLEARGVTALDLTEEIERRCDGRWIVLHLRSYDALMDRAWEEREQQERALRQEASPELLCGLHGHCAGHDDFCVRCGEEVEDWDERDPFAEEV